MSLTRKMLKGMGLTEEQVDTIVEAHTETVDGLKDQLKTAKEKAEKLEAVQKELDGLKANNGDDWKAKHDTVKKELDDLKAAQAAEETKAAKEKAARAYFEGEHITGKNLELAIRAASAEISALDLDKDGKAKDTTKLEALVGNELAGLVVKTSTKGADPAQPPANDGGKTLKREDIYAKDDKGHYKLGPSERQAALVKLNTTKG